MLRRLRGSLGWPLILVLTGATALTGSLAWSAATATAPTFHGCYVLGKKGSFRIVALKTKCRKGERTMTWNQLGPRGLRGLAGTRGATGAAGARGTTGLTGATGARGAAGATGAAGAAGAAGPAGLGLTRPGFTITTVDSGANTDIGMDVTVGSDGLPIVAYHDNANDTLKVAHCQDLACSTSAATAFAQRPGHGGVQTSIAVGADGFPVIANAITLQAASDVSLVHCQNVTCSTSQALRDLGQSGPPMAGTGSVVVGADGLPIVVWDLGTPLPYTVTHCDDQACSQVTETHDPGGATTTGPAGGRSAAVGSDGRVVASDYNGATGDLRIQHCADVTCSTLQFTTVASGDDAGWHGSLAIGRDGLPLVAHYDRTTNDLVVTHCDDAGCSSSTTTTVTATGGHDGQASLAIGADGLGVISYYDTGGANLGVAHCANVACSASTTATVDSTGDVGLDSSLTIGVDGLPLIAYGDTTGTHLKVLHCSNVFCVPYARAR